MSSKKVLVYGGRGALGSACIAKFKELDWVNGTGFSVFLFICYLFCTDIPNVLPIWQPIDPCIH